MSVEAVRCRQSADTPAEPPRLVLLDVVRPFVSVALAPARAGGPEGRAGRGFGVQT
jgi:hypothetical protein